MYVELFKGTASQDELGCLWLWKDKNDLEMNLWQFLKFICCLLVFNFVRYLVNSLATLLLATLWQICYMGYTVVATLGQIFIERQRVSATLRQIPQKVLATFVNSTHLSEGQVPSDPLPEGIDYPLQIAVGRGHWITSRDICKNFPITKTEITFFQYL